MAQLEASPDDFTGLTAENFESTVRDLAKAWRGKGGPVRQQLLAAVSVLDKAVTLSKRERGRRIEMLLRNVVLKRGDFESLATLAVELSASSKNAITSLLPQDLRQKVYKGKTENHPIFDKSVEMDSSPSESTISNDENGNNHSPHPTVLLLGSEEEHKSNRSLLNRNNFIPLRQQTFDELEAIFGSEVAGVVVARSVWTTAAVSEHKNLLQRLFRLSSVLFLRIDVDGLEPVAAGHLLDMRRDVCCSEADASIFCHGSGCQLTPTDLMSITRAASLLEVSSNTQFHPHEIEAAYSHLVRIAATKHVRGHRLDHGIKLEQIRTSFFSHGRSFAKVIVVRPDNGGPGFVMKVDDVDRLRSEMQKYYKYISPWEGRANPELYFHATAAAIIFSLVDSPDVPGSAAPTMDEQVEKAVNGELGEYGIPPPKEDDLTTALARAVKKLVALNRGKSNDKGYGYNWIAETIKALEKKSLVWSIQDVEKKDFSVANLVSQADNIVKLRDSCAVIHGDVHLMNILLRDDREPFFIDYDQSGPGHPCYDLTRLEAAVLFKCFRALAPEARIVEFLTDVSVHGTSYKSLEKKYPELLTSVGNRLATKTCILVRKHCLEVVGAHGGTAVDFFAMKFLVSASALTMLQPQSTIVRATLGALAATLISEQIGENP